jgi:methylthioribose-1-phosphate isomerase
VQVDGRPTRTIRPAADGRSVEIIDQTRLPHVFALLRLARVDDAAHAIRSMQVRGAPLIGVTAAYGIWLQMLADPSDAALGAAREELLATRPTAVNLRFALDEMARALCAVAPAARAARALARANELADEDVAACRAIGEHGAPLIEAIHARSARPVQVLTHCNAGWLATVDWGTALAPIYAAQSRGVPLHVFVDETRPRNQGASLTAWELLQQGVPHTVVADNAGAHLMQRGRVDLVLVGSDRTTARGDVCNKIGTLQKALAAREYGVPFHVALPASTIDWTLEDGASIPIEERSGDELRRVQGRAPSGELVAVEILPAGSGVANPAFDVTPAKLVSGLVTERGRCAASREGLLSLYPERGARR